MVVGSNSPFLAFCEDKNTNASRAFVEEIMVVVQPHFLVIQNEAYYYSKLCIGDSFLKFFVFTTSIVRSRSCLLNRGRCDCGCVVHSMDVKRMGKEAFQWCRCSWKKWISNPIGPGDVYTPCPAFGNNRAPGQFLSSQTFVLPLPIIVVVFCQIVLLFFCD